MLAPGCWQASQDAGGAQCVGWEQGTGSSVPLETSQSPLPKKKKNHKHLGPHIPLANVSIPWGWHPTSTLHGCRPLRCICASPNPRSQDLQLM